MNFNRTVIIPSQVLARGVGEETVILHLTSGTYFGLDPVGARIWELMSQSRTLAEICDVVEAEYEVERAQVERDLLKLLDELVAHQLVAMA